MFSTFTKNARKRWDSPRIAPVYGFTKTTRSLPKLNSTGECGSDRNVIDVKSVPLADLRLLARASRDDRRSLKYGTLKPYPGLPHWMPTTHAEQINADLLAFVEREMEAAA